MTASARAVRWIIAAVVIAALVGSMVLVSVETASTQPIRTRVGIKVTDRTVRPKQKITFFGKVKSPRGKCRKRRVVVLKRKGTGKVKQKRTDREGEYRFRIDPKPNRGRYFVKAKKKFVNIGYGYPGYGYTERRKCRADTSRIIRIRPAVRR
jgi:hypothetical protein